MKTKLLSVCLFVFLFSIIFLLLGCPPVDKPPKLTIPDKTVDEGQVLQFDLKQYAEDKDKNTLVFTIVSGVGEIVESDYRYAPTFDESGEKEVKIRVTNAKGKSAEDTFKITVNDVNRPPALDIPDQTIDEGETLTLDLNVYADDPDGDDLTFTLVSGVGEITDATYTYTTDYDVLKKVREYNPAAESVDFEVSISANDGKGGEATATFTIRVTDVNRPPVLDIPDQTIDEGETLKLNLLDYTTDPDTLDTFTYTLISGVGNIAGSTYTYTATYTDAGTKTVTVRVTDNKGGTGECEFNIEVIEAGNPPEADFRVIESSPTEGRKVHFDASDSSDEEDSTDELIIRWDFNGDGTWEIDFSANKRASEVVSHVYSLAGSITVVVEVKDSQGLISRKEKQIQINLAPPQSLYLESFSDNEITIVWNDMSTSEDSYRVSLNDNPLAQLPANTENHTFELDKSATQTISVYCTKGAMESNKTELVIGMNLSESTTVFEEVSITLPASHVGKRVTISVTNLSEELPEGCNVFSAVYDISVEGLTDEDTELPVEVSFTSGSFENADNSFFMILHYDDDLGEWIPAYTVFQNGKYKTFTTHFSTYVLTSVETSSEILTKRVESYSVQKYGLNFTNSPGKVLDAGKLLGVADFTSQEGVCYGMVMTSLGLFNMGLGFADPIFNFGGDLEPRLAWNSVRGYYITCTPIAEFVEIKQEDGPGLISCVERLIDRTFTDNITNANNTYLLLAEGIPVVLSLGSYVQDVGDEDHDGDTTDIIRRGHAVLAYGVKVEGSSVYVFSIYDPNRPQVNSELMINNGKVVGYYSDYSEMLCIGVDSRTGPGRMTLLTENLDESYSPWFKDVYYYINDNSIKLSWWNHCRPDRSLPSSQYIKRSEGGNFSNISTINISVKNYADTSIEVNKEYKYKVSRSDGKETPEVSVFTRYYDVVPETGSKVNKKGFTVTFPQLPSGNIIVIALYLKEGVWEYLTRNNGFSNSSDFTEDDCNKLFRNSDSATIRFVAYNNDYDGTYAVRDVTYYVTDNDPPTVTKVSGPNGAVSESTSTFSWTGNAPGGTITKYEYRKDGGSWVNHGLNTSYTWSGYAEGPHKFEVRAQDNKGEYSEPAEWTFTYSTGAVVVGEMVLVEGGTFMMGDEFGDLWDGCRPVHQVTLTYDFWLGKYEVTFDEYDAFCNATGRSKPGDSGWGRGQRPVIWVSWWDAIAYCNWLSEKNGLPKAYDNSGNLLDASGKVTTDITKVLGYRLPTEAEWEYAARGGKHRSPYKYSGSDNVDIVAWYSYNSGGRTHEVGQKLPNALGIYDMSGNVWEWCSDWWYYYTETPKTNPYNSTAGSDRVFRGGCCYYNATNTRVAFRNLFSPTVTISALGFRICRTVP